MKSTKTITAGDDYLDFTVFGRNAVSGITDGPGTFEIAVSGRVTSTIRLYAQIDGQWVQDSVIAQDGVHPGTVATTRKYRIGCPVADYEGETIYIEVAQ
jgi:hypothetical protein